MLDCRLATRSSHTDLGHLRLVLLVDGELDVEQGLELGRMVTPFLEILLGGVHGLVAFLGRYGHDAVLERWAARQKPPFLHDVIVVELVLLERWVASREIQIDYEPLAPALACCRRMTAYAWPCLLRREGRTALASCSGELARGARCT